MHRKCPIDAGLLDAHSKCPMLGSSSAPIHFIHGGAVPGQGAKNSALSQLSPALNEHRQVSKRWTRSPSRRRVIVRWWRCVCSSAWEEQKGATHSLQAAADGFTGRGHKARFRSQGGALPGRGDEVRTHPSRGGWGPGDLQLDHCSRGAKGTPRKANLKGNWLATVSWAPTVCWAIPRLWGYGDEHKRRLCFHGADTLVGKMENNQTREWGVLRGSMKRKFSASRDQGRKASPMWRLRGNWIKEGASTCRGKHSQAKVRARAKALGLD